MTTIFYKYHGSGNDFILIDNRAGIVALNTEQIAHLCHRHMGIGADGLMLLESALDKDFIWCTTTLMAEKALCVVTAAGAWCYLHSIWAS